MQHRFDLPPADLQPWLVAAMSVEMPDAGAPRLNRFPALVGGMLTVVLDGRIELLPGPARANAHALLPGAFFYGPGSAPMVSCHTGRLHCMTLLVQPAAMSSLLGAAAADVRDRAVPAADLWGTAWSACEDALRAASDDAARRAHLYAFVRRRVADRQAQARRERYAGLASAACATLDGAARGAGVGERQFERVFTANLGLRPKLFQRVARIEAALRELAAHGRGGAELALRHGWFDQAHMARDFRQLVGASPRQLLAELDDPASEHWPLQVGTRSGGAGAAAPQGAHALAGV